MRASVRARKRAFALARRERKPITVTYNTSTFVLTVADRASGTALFTDYIGRFDDMSTTSVSFRLSAEKTVAITWVSLP